uniref:Lrp/AsnC ligand binding domain-containing protein n=2 Tax=Sphingomonas alpina TaxID=653931 RepID=UPI0028E38046|nr:Lrp/AsnC ligand binding domain-containing protein [Sphingomonas alpina]
MNPVAKPDAIDRRILAALQDDGRMSNLALARRVGLTPTPCQERVKRLERDGYITGYTARLDPVRLDLGLLVFVQVTLDRTTTDVFGHFAAAIRSFAAVTECHMVAGGFDYLLKIRCRDMADYRRILGDELGSIDGIAQTHTYAVMEEIKAETALPV